MHVCEQGNPYDTYNVHKTNPKSVRHSGGLMTIGHEEFSKQEGEEESSSGVGATPLLEERRRDRERSLSSWCVIKNHCCSKSSERTRRSSYSHCWIVKSPSN